MWKNLARFLEELTMALDKKNENPIPLQEDIPIKKAKTSVLWSESDSKEVKRLLAEGKVLMELKMDRVKYEKYEMTRAKRNNNVVKQQADFSAIIQKLDTLTQLVTLCLKNQDEHFKRINQIWEHRTQ